DLTGKENLQIYASLVGMSRSQTARYHDEIVDFAELHDYMDEPIRTYSSGMVMRLAFGVAVHHKTDLLIIDEIMAVGDAAFQDKCVHRIRTLQKSGHSLLFVSHSPVLVAQFCDTALWLDQGRVMRVGPSAEVTNAYMEFLSLAPIPAVSPAEPVPKAKKVRR
ncbi:MAG: ABC transporter ATP-binding protein, partial [Bryobacteraceae bacterium]|nr:ABC transporter ATP-binding protein [Bryobacteraceae bacterium]